MKTLFIIATAIVIYTTLNFIKPMFKKREVKNTNKVSEDSKSSLMLSTIPLSNVGLPPVVLPYECVSPTVSITKPTLLIGKNNSLKIYYPDNSVEIYNNRWKRYQTPHQSVYSYATATHSDIIENID
jgi:hypothetical protein